jgi:hypothetical protein
VGAASVPHQVRHDHHNLVQKGARPSIITETLLILSHPNPPTSASLGTPDGFGPT